MEQWIYKMMIFASLEDCPAPLMLLRENRHINLVFHHRAHNQVAQEDNLIFDILAC